MNTILVVCAILITAALIIAVIFLVQTLIQVRKASREMEFLLKSINGEVSAVVHITSSISKFFDNLGSPWFKAGGWFAGIISSAIRSGRKKGQENTAKE